MHAAKLDDSHRLQRVLASGAEFFTHAGAMNPGTTAPLLTIEAPIKTVSEMNQREHWAVKNKRRATQRREVYYAWKVAVAGSRRRLGAPYTVRLTRLGHKLLDDDNLRGAFKFIRDQVAELLGMDDADERLRFEYDQRAGTVYGVVIEVFQEPHRP